ncbi:MAG: SDR family oxidoreductase [Acidobacteria bacterium]|nr:SDR family oxidoreductase [Acidobacteriota bacterium]
MGLKALSLEGRNAVTIGGTTGIGRAISLGLAEAGANVIASSRDAEHVNRVASEIEQYGRRTIRKTSDVTDRSSLERLRDAAVAECGRIDILVNCAGKSQLIPTLDITEEDWNRILEINLTGTLRACQIFGRHMLENGYGRVINILSMSSFVALYRVTSYAAAKSGAAALTRSLAIEWGPLGVNVNGIAPGFFLTQLTQKMLEGTPRGREVLMRTPLKRFGRLEEVAGAAVYLASDAASFVNGEIIVIDGGILASGVNQI